MTAARPPAVERFAEAMADWLASYTVPAPLGVEMVEACAAGGAWPAAIGGTAVRRAGWPDAEALAWGVALGGVAGAIEAARACLAAPAGRGADGPARPLLAADGLVAAAHEALGGLEPGRLRAALAALAPLFSASAAWEGGAAGWAAVVPCALAPAAAEDPRGPWGDLAAAWSAAYGRPGAAAPGGDDEALWRHPAADGPTRALFKAAAREAATPAEARVAS